MPGSVLHFDFSKSATRREFFGPVVALTPDAERPLIAAQMNDVSIPREAQLHNLAEVCDAINKTIASDWAKQEAKTVYAILAEAEAKVHGVPVEETHFHEVGKGSTCLEILSICTALEIAKPEKITATPVQVGSGTVECSHGILDIPAPATAAILEKYEIPIQKTRLEGELCTPTSAALIAHFVEAFDE